MNLMDKGAIDIAEFTFRSAGNMLGMPPVSVSCNGVPFRSTVLLLTFPSSGVRWSASTLAPTPDPDNSLPAMLMKSRALLESHFPPHCCLFPRCLPCKAFKPNVTTALNIRIGVIRVVLSIKLHFTNPENGGEEQGNITMKVNLCIMNNKMQDFDELETKRKQKD
nr:hypothetical protein Iba_chr09eCG10400 [Ipomoea batatas]GMD37577.1 hypothetical protein Iba_chr09eCG10680 [Ipomoea batatas]